MKKIIFLLILFLIPVSVRAKDYVVNKKDYTVRITTNRNINNDNEILIIDERNNSNIKIVNSYKIKSSKIKNEILDIILEYTRMYPNNKWVRTKDSLYAEWIVHNILYKFNLYEVHTISVDFETKEENRYKIVNNYLQVLRSVL